MRLKTRPQLHFGKLQITWATFDTLRDAGFDVMHDGLIQELEENYLRYGSVNYRLHSVGKSLSASIGLLDDSVTWRFTAKVSLKDNWQWNSHPTFWSPPFQFPGDWRDLVGKTAEINYRFGQQPEGGLNFGQRVSPEKNRFRFVSRTGNQIRLRGDFHANPPGQGAGKIDVVLPFEFVYVETGLNYLPEDAKELLGQHFDIEDFDEPVEVEVNYWFNSQSAAKFRLKKSLRTEADHN